MLSGNPPRRPELDRISTLGLAQCRGLSYNCFPLALFQWGVGLLVFDSRVAICPHKSIFKKRSSVYFRQFQLLVSCTSSGGCWIKDRGTGHPIIQASPVRWHSSAHPGACEEDVCLLFVPFNPGTLLWGNGTQKERKGNVPIKLRIKLFLVDRARAKTVGSQEDW